MKYYVSVGPGGVFFRIGLAVNGMLGSVVYWWASRGRGAPVAMKQSVRVTNPLPGDGRSMRVYDQFAAGRFLRSSARDGAAVPGIDR